MEAAFIEIGLSDAKAKETAKNEKLAKNLGYVIDGAKTRGRNGDGLKRIGSLLYHVASKLKAQVFGHADTLVDYICSGKIDSEVRLNAALDYVLKNPEPIPADKANFESACGVGVVVTPEQIEQSVEKAVAAVKAEIVAKRYRYPTGMLMGAVRKELPWADGQALKGEIDMQVLELLGPKTDADRAPPPKQEKKRKEPKEGKKKDGAATKEATPVSGKATSPVAEEEKEEDGATTIAELMRTKVHFHKPGENFITDGYVRTPKTNELIAAHLKRTGGQVRTRFPPEPNGLLHIGHAKAININFGYAAAHGGTCNLRYDDTNPEKEEEKFFTGIKDMVEWLGYKPARITHSSDNFGQLYEWAKFLIEKELAYVCHQKVEDIRGFNPPPSPWRERPVSESRQLFEDMKNGKFDEGEATLRLKTTLEEGKQDPVAYRIKYAAHHRTGEEWCIYPSVYLSAYPSELEYVHDIYPFQHTITLTASATQSKTSRIPFALRSSKTDAPRITGFAMPSRSTVQCSGSMEGSTSVTPSLAREKLENLFLPVSMSGCVCACFNFLLESAHLQESARIGMIRACSPWQL